MYYTPVSLTRVTRCTLLVHVCQKFLSFRFRIARVHEESLSNSTGCSKSLKMVNRTAIFDCVITLVKFVGRGRLSSLFLPFSIVLLLRISPVDMQKESFSTVLKFMILLPKFSTNYLPRIVYTLITNWRTRRSPPVAPSKWVLCLGLQTSLGLKPSALAGRESTNLLFAWGMESNQLLRHAWVVILCLVKTCSLLQPSLGLGTWTLKGSLLRSPCPKVWNCPH